MRKKEKEYKKISITINPETEEKLNEISTFEGMYKSEFIEFLIENWDKEINPSEKLKFLINEKEKLMNKLSELDNKIKESTKQISLLEVWRKQKSIKKEEALIILQRKILERDFQDAEKMAKVWQRITGIPALELLLEAKSNLEKKGI